MRRRGERAADYLGTNFPHPNLFIYFLGTNLPIDLGTNFLLLGYESSFPSRVRIFLGTNLPVTELWEALPCWWSSVYENTDQTCKVL